MKIIALTSQKGGTSRSTISINIAAEWTRKGKRVLLVDGDVQGTASTWASVAREKGHTPPRTVYLGARMYKQLPEIAEGYDIAIIDCPPGLGDVKRAALVAADLALLPCAPSAAEAWALVETVDLVKIAQKMRPGLDARIVLTRKMACTSIGRTARQVLGSAGLPLLRTELGYRTAYQESPAAGLGVTEYLPGSFAAAEIYQLCHELERLLYHAEETSDRAQKTAQRRDRGIRELGSSRNGSNQGYEIVAVQTIGA